MVERVNSDETSVRLEMRGICKRFGATVALEDVSIDVSGGEVLALVGENGAGKSTLMKVLSGALKADAGEMWLNGAAGSVVTMRLSCSFCFALNRAKVVRRSSSDICSARVGYRKARYFHRPLTTAREKPISK